jgi:hypothetical protein
VLTFIMQTSFSRKVLERFGLAAATGAPSIALITGGLAGLLIPPLRTAGVVLSRGGEAVLRGSLFRSGYELFYTPLAVAEKRAAKSTIDVGCDRLGELVGALGIQLVLIANPVAPNSPIIVLGIITSAAAVLFANRLNHGYVSALERSLLNRAVELDLSDVEDLTTKTVMLRTLQRTQPRGRVPMDSPSYPERLRRPRPRLARQLPRRPIPMFARILALRSRESHRHSRRPRFGRRALGHARPSRDTAAGVGSGRRTRRAGAPRRGGIPRRRAHRRAPRSQPAVRGPPSSRAGVLDLCLATRGRRVDRGTRRSPLRSAVSMRAVAGGDSRKNPRIRIDQTTIYDVVKREVEVGRPVWEGHRLLDRVEDDQPDRVVDAYLKGRANQSLTHVFTLLSLVIPAEPLRIAFRGLHTTDPNLRGTSLEYLEGVLPPAIHGRLRPFLEEAQLVNRPRGPAKRCSRSC